MNRMSFLKTLPVAFLGLFISPKDAQAEAKAKKLDKIIEHIHITGDNAVISHNIIYGSSEQPAILITKPVKLYDAKGKLFNVGQVLRG